MKSSPRESIAPSHRWPKVAFPVFLTLYLLAAAWLLIRNPTQPSEDSRNLVTVLLLFALAVPGLWLVGYRNRRWPRHTWLYLLGLGAGVVAALVWPKVLPVLLPALGLGLVIELVMEWMTQPDEHEVAAWRCTVCEHLNEPGMPVCTECSAPADSR